MRAGVGGTAIVQGGVYLVKASPASLGLWMVGMLAVASGVLLVMGFLTKAAGILVGLSSVGLAWFPAAPLNSLDAKLLLFLIIVISVALSLIGPGAFSLDSRLFGRREIIIPYNPRSPKS